MELPDHPIIFSNDANIDLESLFDYLLQEAGANIAVEYTYELTQKIDTLSSLPLQGQKADRVERDLRRLVHKNHLVYYRFDSNTVEIIRILDGRQDHARLL